MALVSLKCDENGPEFISDEYGWGTRISLNDDQCEALGIKNPPPAGTKVVVHALAFVTSSTSSVESDGDDKGPDVSLCLQLTDMEVLFDGNRPDAATKLYGGGGEE